MTLTLAQAVVSTDTDVKVSYAKPATGSDNTLKDAAGNEVADLRRPGGDQRDRTGGERRGGVL